LRVDSSVNEAAAAAVLFAERGVRTAAIAGVLLAVGSAALVARMFRSPTLKEREISSRAVATASVPRATPVGTPPRPAQAHGRVPSVPEPTPFPSVPSVTVAVPSPALVATSSMNPKPKALVTRPTTAVTPVKVAAAKPAAAPVAAVNTPVTTPSPESETEIRSAPSAPMEAVEAPVARVRSTPRVPLYTDADLARYRRASDESSSTGTEAEANAFGEAAADDAEANRQRAQRPAPTRAGE
jgi:hypothetical protein